MSIYSYSEELQNIIDNLKLEIKYKNIKIDIMNYLPYIRKGYISSGSAVIHTLFKISQIFGNNIDTNLDFIKHMIFIGYVDENEISKIHKISQESMILCYIEVISNVSNIYEILRICTVGYRHKYRELVDMITTNNNMKLIYNILRENIGITKMILNRSDVCPFIGYSVARLKDNEINTYVKSICTKKNMVYKTSVNY